MDMLAQQEQDQQLLFHVSGEVLNLTGIESIPIFKVVCVVYGIQSLYAILQISIQAIKLKAGQDIQIGPNVQVKESDFLFLAYCSLFL